MSATPLAGYITKKQIEERYNRSHRSLTRDFSAAVRVGDRKVLSHLKLRTDDGAVRDGTGVTLDDIQELSNRGLTPTWYVEQAWAEKTYANREEKLRKSAEKKVPATPDENVKPAADDQPTPGSDLLSTLRDQIAALKKDKEDLRQELQIKNDQIREANERTRESNKLMGDLQVMLSDWQKQAFASLSKPEQQALAPSPPMQQPEPAIDVGQRDDASEPGTESAKSVVLETSRSPAMPKHRRQQSTKKHALAKTSPAKEEKKGTKPARPSNKKRPPAKPAQKRKASPKTARKRNAEAKQAPSVFEKHTPTFRKALKSFLGRR